MPSCSRIAFRCGDLDARTSGGAGAASAIAFPGLPDLLGRPLARPLGRNESVVRMGLRRRRCLQLDQVENVQAVRAQEPDPIPVREVELRSEEHTSELQSL